MCGCLERFSPTGIDRGRTCLEHTDHFDLMDACKAKNFDLNIVLGFYTHWNGNVFPTYTHTSKDTVDITVDEDGNEFKSKPKHVKHVWFWESCVIAETEDDPFNKFIRVYR